MNEKQKKRLKEKLILMYYKSKKIGKKLGLSESQEDKSFDNVISEILEKVCQERNYNAQQKQELSDFLVLLKKDLDTRFATSRIALGLYVCFLKFKRLFLR